MTIRRFPCFTFVCSGKGALGLLIKKLGLALPHEPGRGFAAVASLMYFLEERYIQATRSAAVPGDSPCAREKCARRASLVRRGLLRKL